MNTSRCWSTIGIVVIALCLAGKATADETIPACAAQLGRVVSSQGLVQLRRGGVGPWYPVRRLETVLCEGDLIHTGARSRAAVVLMPESVVRLDQNATLLMRPDGDHVQVEMILDRDVPPERLNNVCGRGYFVTRLPRRFKVYTPFLNAAVEGTEFQIALACNRASLSVFEGHVAAASPAFLEAGATLAAGQEISAGPGSPLTAVSVILHPEDSVQWALFYPAVGERGSLDECVASDPESRGRCLLARAETLLSVGSVEEARAGIDAVMDIMPLSADALALKSVVALVSNHKDEALELARRALKNSDKSGRAWLALSYAQQAHFNLQEALDASRKAVHLEPDVGLAQARNAELLLSLGQLQSAEAQARAVVAKNPGLSRAHTVLGFIHLARIETRDAEAAFGEAIVLDSVDPLPRLGLGLAMIRAGSLQKGREQIEIAVALDPSNALIRSYMGKAYYEENTDARDGLAQSQFALAKKLDPRDPTPYFYDAILKQSQNRAYDAVMEHDEALARNDNRAVLRSRLALDDDRSVRQSSLAQVYTDMGFIEEGRRVAAQALAEDSAVSGGHRLLAQVYGQRANSDGARASELLQSELLTRHRLTPLRPAEVQRRIVEDHGLGFSALGAGEYTPLLQYNRVGGSLSAGVASHVTRSWDALLYGLGDPFSVSLGVHQFRTAGVRENDDLHQGGGYGAFSVTPDPFKKVYVAFEEAEIRQGDRQRRFRYSDTDFDPTLRDTEHGSSQLIGLRLGTSPEGGLSLFLRSAASRVDSRQSSAGFDIVGVGREEALAGEVQYQHRFDSGFLLGGIRQARVDTFDSFDLGGFVRAATGKYEFVSFYAYGSTTLAGRIHGTLGLSYVDEELSRYAHRRNQDLNPKLAVAFDITDSTVLTLAGARTSRWSASSTVTLEPTQVQGVVQDFDDLPGTRSTLGMASVAHRFAPGLRAGANFSRRLLTVFYEEIDFLGTGTAKVTGWQENTSMIHAYWNASPTLSLAAEYKVEWIEASDDLVTVNGIRSATTRRLDLRGIWTPSERIVLRLSPFYVSQHIESQAFGAPPVADSAFLVMNASLEYRLPRRSGRITLGVANLLDRHFRYQQDTLADYLSNRSVSSRESLVDPERTLFLTVSFDR